MKLIRRNRFFLIFLILFVACGEKYIHKSTKVEVHFSVDRNMFPYSWRNHEIDPHARSLPLSLRHEAMDIIQEAFDKYPVHVIRENLKKIYVLNELKFYGVNYGGTNTVKTVYLVHHFYTKEYIERTFHHEFGAVLMYSNNFDTTAFKAFLPDTVYYGNGGLDAIISGKSSLYIDYELLEIGFLNEYGSSCVEEDFCTSVEQLFKPDEDFWEIYEKYPIIHNKIKFIIDFYHSIDTTFNERYFREFDKEKIVSQNN